MAITVKQLRLALSQCSPDAEIRMASDAECNSIHDLHTVDKGSKKGVVYLVPAHEHLEDE